MKKDLPLLFRQLTHGVYVIGVGGGENVNAFTAAWVMQVSFDPLMLALAIHPRHSSYDMLVSGGKFSVNVLPAARTDLAEHFGQSASAEKLADIQWHPGNTGVPVIDQSVAFFECEYSHECASGDHVIIIGRVVDGQVLDADTEPMNYRDTGDMDGSSRLYPPDFN